MRVAIWMDSIEKINTKKDSTVAILEKALSLGWECFYFTSQHVYTKSDGVFADVARIHITAIESPEWAILSDPVPTSLADFDIILMRKDPPFDLEYIYVTYALEWAEAQGVTVSNKPSSVRGMNEKYGIMHFPDIIPETLVTKDMSKLHAFWKAHEEVIIKPLDGMGGANIFYVDKQGLNVWGILESTTVRGQRTVMMQAYIPDILKGGDKRILMIHGKPIPFALARMPKPGDFRGNLAAGASGKVVALSYRDKAICDAVSPFLRAQGLHLVGLDVIGDYLTEINVTSPTCFREIMQEADVDIPGLYLNAF